MSVVTQAAKRIAIPDPTFVRWAEHSLVWLPDCGMGYLPAAPIEYGDEYWDKYVGYAHTALGRRLTTLRIEMVGRHAKIGLAPTVIDIGIGCGDFVERATQTWDMQVCGYDVNRAAVEWLTDRGLYRDPYAAPFDVACFFDSLEHIEDAHRILENVTGWAFCALPIFRNAEHVLASKHLRPGEHLFYWTREGLIGWMAAQGFVCTEHNTTESLAGREDISSFAFRRCE